MMTGQKKRSLLKQLGFFLITWIWLSQVLAIKNTERIIVEVIVNGYNAGQHFLRQTKAGDVLVSPQFLKELHIIPSIEPNKPFISLRSLAKMLQFQLDQNNARLTLAVAPEQFEPQTFQYQASPPLKTLSPLPRG